MAKGKINWPVIKDRLTTKVQTDIPRLKKYLVSDLRIIIDNEGWKQFEDPSTNKPFADVAVFLTTRFPSGIGCGQMDGMLTYEGVMDMAREEDTAVYSVLAKHAPKGKSGRKRKGEQIEYARIQLNRRQPTRNVLAARLAQEKPRFMESFERGEYKSIRAAAEAAGLVKPGHDPLARAKSYYRKMTTEQRTVFHEWLKTKEAKSLGR